MVVSRIDDNVVFFENSKIEKLDKNTELDLYKVKILNIDVVIAIGTIIDSHKNENINYFPIYLIKKNKKSKQIGIYEIVASKKDDYFDSNMNILFKKLPRPLLYSFVNDKLLKEEGISPLLFFEDEIEKTDEIVDDEKSMKDNNNKLDTSDIPKERNDIFKLNKGIIIPDSLEEEDKEENEKIEKSYELNKEDVWIQKFMKNPNYNIVDTERDGNCFFNVVKQSFMSIGQETSIDKLREKISNNASDKIFNIYRDRYELFYGNLLNITKQIKQLNQEYIKIKETISKVTDRNEKKALLLQAKEIKILHDSMLNEKKVIYDYYNEYKIMKDVDTLEKFKRKIKKCEFWADIWIISLMERILNIKFIIFSEENYMKNDEDNVLQCGEINDEILKERGVFTPEYYIIINHTGDHYQLLSYKKKMILKFPEIPWKVKKMIATKCMETNAGSFNIISNFETFKKDNTGKSNSNNTIEDVTESELQGLFDPNIVFQFYSKSKASLPGKGAGEKLPENLSETMINNFKKLHSKNPEWRKVLSNFYEKPFTLDNHQWLSVEHYYQASKFKNNNQTFYLSFTLDSGTELSKDPVMAKGAGGKTGKFKGKLIRPREVTIDSDFFNKRHKEEMYNSQFAKFSQNPELGKILVCTGRAKLTHFSRGSPPIVFDELMMIRNKLSKTINCE